MTRTALFDRPAGLALCLIALSATGGCAHLREGAQRARAQAQAERAETARAPKPSPEPKHPAPVRAAKPAPAPKPAIAKPSAPLPSATLPSAPPPVIAPPPKAELPPKPVVIAPVTPAPRAAPPEKPSVPPRLAPATTPAPSNRTRESVLDGPMAATLTPSTGVAIQANTGPAIGAQTLPTSKAVIIFASTPSPECDSCETLKLSVTPSGTVLIERSHMTGANRDLHYRRVIAHVGPARAAAFAASLEADRPAGISAQTNPSACPGPIAQHDRLSVEWIEAERDDEVTVDLGCPADRDSPLAQRLRHAPDVLGLPRLTFPWSKQR